MVNAKHAALLLFLAPAVFFPPRARAQTAAETYPLDKAEQVPGRGLVLHTEPEGATVYVDGVEQRGVTPMTLAELGGGEYNIRLYKEGYAERRFRAPVSEGSRLAVTMELKPLTGVLLLTMRPDAPLPEDPPSGVPPFEPVLYIDGLPVREPINMAGQRIVLPRGRRRLEVKAFGWETQSRLVLIGKDETAADFAMKPAAPAFSSAVLTRKRFNPAAGGAAGRVEIRYTVTAPCGGRFLITDAAGNVVREEALRFTAPDQILGWGGTGADGRPLGDGVYTLTVEIASPAASGAAGETVSFSFQVIIDSSFSVYPLSAPAGQAGLVLCPLPETIPHGSFQMEGGLLFGAVPDGAEPWKSLPGEAALRFSPLDGLETAAFLNMAPYFDRRALWGAGASARYGFPIPGGLRGAASVTFAWSEQGAASFLGPGSGLTFSAPLSWQKGFFTLAFSPGLTWYEPWSSADSYPAGSARLLFPAGALFRHRVFSVGASCRADVDCAPGSLAAFKAGAEIKIHPSSLVVSVTGGAAWIDSRGWGGWGGALVGVVY